MEKVILSQIIKELVLENGQAVLPGFGIFSTENVSASFSEGGRKINPPTKKIVFAEDASVEGGELMERVSSKLNESVQEVEKPLKEQMKSLAQELRKNKKLVLEGFGTLVLNNGAVDFQPDGDKDFFAEMYALEPIMLRFAEHEPEPEAEFQQSAPKEKLEPAERQSRWFTALIIILSVVIIASLLLILGRNGAFDSLLYSDEELELIERAGD